MSKLIWLLLRFLGARLEIVKGLDFTQGSKNASVKWANAPMCILAVVEIMAYVSGENLEWPLA